ncbi:PucR family transcriptional regulator [Blastococcus litoris]|uniref:PucR family transcriptional regulator n=1 Tax=Blastococcus litoris TaxID=2171622 RepID=UPI000E303D03|nr:helix-turn-helix domain-containing protein [Blastococcus litoris]
MTTSDWSPVAELCRRVTGDLDRLARDSVTTIRRDLPAYAAVPHDEHLAAVTEQQRRRLDALAGRRLLAPADLERAADLARRRARQGIGVDVLIGAYHLGDQELWRALCADPGPAAPLLPDVAAQLLRLLHAISTVLASAHGDVTRELHSHRATLSSRLLELLVAGRDDAEAARLADALGLDPRGDFVAATWATSGADVVLPPEVARELDRAPVPVVHSSPPGAVVVLARGDGDDWLAGTAGRLPMGGPVGVGLRRRGLRGAVVSLGDARLALGAAGEGGGVTRFGDVWAQACLLAETERLEPLVATAVRTAGEHPHLAETVLAFAAADMSVARTAEALHLHANSVTYRLQRWAQLTAWDPRSFEQLVASAVACRVALRGSSR